MSLSHRLGLLGRKVGMMRIFTDDGDAVPVTSRWLGTSPKRVSKQVKSSRNSASKPTLLLAISLALKSL